MKNNKGLTLIEISFIVIVISIMLSFFITIVVNRDKNNIKSLAKDLYQYNLAIKNFQIKYGFLPGDLKKTDILYLSVNNTDGNENNLIDDKNQQNNIFDKNIKMDGELVNFWLHLYNAKMLNNDAKVLPYVNFAKSSIVVFNDMEKNYYNLSIKAVMPSGEIETFNNFTPYQAYLLDRKIDDSLANSGKIIASGGNRININSKNEVHKKCAVDDEYLTAHKKKLCQLIYEININ